MNRISIYDRLRKVFTFYVVVVLTLWTLPRLICNEFIANAANRINWKFLLEDICWCIYIPENIVLKIAPPLAIVILIIVYWKFQPFFSRLIVAGQGSPEQERTRNRVSPRHIWLTASFVVLFLLFKEVWTPFYFTQDDNHSQFLPKILVGMELLFQGEFPFIDNYQHFGTKIFEIGTYAVFDPLMIISYAASRFILSQPYATFELYTALSFLVGAIFLGYSFRILNVASFLSCGATISFLLSGYFFIVTRSWYYVAGIACYLPILFYFLLRAYYFKTGWWWFLSVGIIRSLFFYAGNAQYFVYTLIIESVAYILFRERRKERLVNYAISLLLTAGLICPLLVSQLDNLKEIVRPAEALMSRYGIPMDAIISAVLPYPFSWAPHPAGWGNENTFLMTNMFHVGFIWVLTFIMGLVGYLHLNKNRYGALLILGTLFFFIAGGPVSLIYPLKHYMPFLSKMYFAFKVYPFAVFIIIIYSTIILNNLIKHIAFRRNTILLMTLSVIGTLLIALFGTGTSFYSYAEKPYPPLKKAISENIVTQEDIIFGVAPARHEDKPYVTAIPHNYGCLYDIRGFNYYDPLVATKLNIYSEGLDKYCSMYGITKVVVLKTKNIPDTWVDGEPLENYLTELKKYPVLYEDGDVTLYKTNAPHWTLRLAYDSVTGGDYQITEYDRAVIKAKINSHVASRWEYHNEYKKGYYAKVNGVKEEIVSSPEGWCMFQLPAGDNHIEIRYEPPAFWQGIWLGVILIVSAISIFYLVNQNNLFGSSRLSPWIKQNENRTKDQVSG